MLDGLKEMSKKIAAAWLALCFMVLPVWAEDVQQFDLGIESMRSHSYSVGIFIFMMVAMALFLGIIIGFWRHESSTKVKTGEKIMFLAIILGVFVSAIFAAIQLLDGFLF
ncbi:MAG: hypothetical protein Q9M22_07580 [Mariprofundaceae bacterium]|nr:hypothetical protein [Mariprofundaceae bacterium]